MALAAQTVDFISSQTDTSSYASSQGNTPPANSLLIATILTTQGSGSTPPTPSSVTGWGLTWSLVYGPNNFDPTGVTVTVTRYAALQGGSPSSGNLSVTLSGTSTSGSALVDAVTGLSGGSEPSEYVLQSVIATGSGTSGSATLAALASSSNMAYVFGTEQNNEDLSVGSGFTLLDSRHHPSPSVGYATETKLNATATSFSWATNGAYMILASEIGNPSTAITLGGDSATIAISAASSVLTMDVPLSGDAATIAVGVAASVLGGDYPLTGVAASLGVSAADSVLLTDEAGTTGIRLSSTFIVLAAPAEIGLSTPVIQWSGLAHDLSATHGKEIGNTPIVSFAGLSHDMTKDLPVPIPVETTAATGVHPSLSRRGAAIRLAQVGRALPPCLGIQTPPKGATGVATSRGIRGAAVSLSKSGHV